MRYRKILLLLLTILGVLSFIPRSRAANFHNIEVEKDVYYPNEILNISASWENSEFVSGDFYTIEIFDSMNNKLWRSDDYRTHVNEIDLYVSIKDLSINLISYVGDIELRLIWNFYAGGGYSVRNSEKFALLKRDFNYTTKGFVEELEQKETLNILIELFDIPNGTCIENYTVGIHFNEKYREENVTKSIEIHIGKDELEYGMNIIKISFKRTLLYDEYELILRFTLEEQKDEEVLEQSGNIIFLIIIIGVVSTIFGGIVYNGQQSRILDPMEITFRE